MKTFTIRTDAFQAKIEAKNLNAAINDAIRGAFGSDAEQ